MISTNKELVKKSRESLSGKWGMAVGALFVYSLIALSVSMFGTGWDMITGAIAQGPWDQLSPVSSLLSLIITGPFTLGIAIFVLALITNSDDFKMEQIFWGFRTFPKAFVTYLLMFIFIVLWTLLLVIPGIIASLAYSQTFYLLADDKDITPMDALRKSKAMMKGYKWKLFALQLRFLGLTLLCLVFTFGIGLLWLMPYMSVTYGHFYLELKESYESSIEE